MTDNRKKIRSLFAWAVFAATWVCFSAAEIQAQTKPANITVADECGAVAWYAKSLQDANEKSQATFRATILVRQRLIGRPSHATIREFIGSSVPVTTPAEEIDGRLSAVSAAPVDCSAALIQAGVKLDSAEARRELLRAKVPITINSYSRAGTTASGEWVFVTLTECSPGTKVADITSGTLLKRDGATWSEPWQAPVVGGVPLRKTIATCK
jgi:hypothetical protein